MRLTAPALVLAGLFFAACSSSKTNNTDGGTDGGGACQSARDCAASDPTQCTSPKVCVCSNSMCVPVCQTNSDCNGNQICVEGSCSNPGCGGNADCTSGQVCIGGNCESPVTTSQIHSCVIAPLNADVRQGGTVQLSVIAQDSSGNALPFTGATWSVPAATTWATVDTNTGIVTGGAATAGGSQPATITATISSSITCTANVNVYGTVTAASTMRVVVIDEDTKAPVGGAYVVLDTNTAGAKQTAVGGDGSVNFTLASGSGAHNVHVFAANYDYATYIGITSTDVLIPIRQFYPIAQRAPFDGSISVSDFDTLTELNEIVRIAFFGSSVSGSLLDFTLDDFIGQQQNVAIDIGGNFVIPGAPQGLVIGLGSDLYGAELPDGGANLVTTEPYSMYADPGRRILWGIGGNLDINTILTVAGPIISGGTANLNIGTLLPEVLPLLGNLEFGDVVGVTPGASGPSPVAINQSVTLDTPMRMNVAVKSPNLPQFNGTYVDGVIALAGASAFPLGFTPLGITAGLAATDSNMVKTGAILNPNCTASATVNCATNILPLQVAARNHGLESYPYGVVLVALNFGALTSGGSTIAVSGKVQNEDTIAFSGGSSAPTQVDMSTAPFMALPGSANSVSYGTAARTITITSDADANTQIYKFTLQASSHQTWSVYLPPAGGSGSTATLINPTDVSSSLVDLTAGGTGTGWISAIQTDSASNTYSTLTGFGNPTVDALGTHLQAFAVQTVALGN